LPLSTLSIKLSVLTNMSGSKAGKKVDHIQRGVTTPNAVTTAVFVGLRALDPFLQYHLLKGAGATFLSKIGASALPLAAAHVTGVPFIDALGLPLPRLILLGMSAGSFLRQAYWILAVCREPLTMPAAVMIGGYNAFMNSLNSLLLICAATSATRYSPFPGTTLSAPIVVGVVMFALGISLEVVSEAQRQSFKSKPENKGKVMKTGLWSWARHINYGGYSIWRGAYCLAGSGWIGGLLMGLFLALDFTTRAVVVLDEYCSKRYGEQWAQFKREVKWVIFPGIY
jgi:protein-S-isoprenylcysteine O-methyltransferase Ste14